MPTRARPLRFKLALWFLLAFVAIEALIVGGSVVLRRDTIRNALDQELERQAEAMVENVLVTQAELTTAELRPLIPSQGEFLFFVVRRSDGGEVATWNLPAETRVPISDWEIVPSGPIGAVTRDIGPVLAAELTGDPRPMRMITLPFRYRGALHYLQVAVRDEYFERLLGPFQGLVAIGVPVGLAVAALAAWVIARRAVAPLERLSRAAREVSPTRLDERFATASSDAEIRRLEHELNSALERLQRGYEAQREFIANVSHELRTPIAVLLTESQVAALDAGSDKDVEFIRRVEAEMRRLGRLVESLLVLARADLEGRRSHEDVSLPDVVLDSLRRCRALAERDDVRLVTQLEVDGEDLIVAGDPDLLQAMLENLLRNAIRFSPPNEDVTIELQRTADAEVAISISDRGPGVPEEQRQRIFERFRRGPLPPGKASGSGLGLAIARSVAELHGGRLRLQDRAGSGSTFVVTLPLART